MLLGPDRPKFWQVRFKIHYVISCACVYVFQPCRLKMAASVAWLSVLVKRGHRIVQKTKICKWEHSFGELLVQAQHTLSCETVSDHVTIIDPRSLQIMSTGPSNIKLNWYGLTQFPPPDCSLFSSVLLRDPLPLPQHSHCCKLVHCTSTSNSPSLFFLLCKRASVPFQYETRRGTHVITDLAT